MTSSTEKIDLILDEIKTSEMAYNTSINRAMSAMEQSDFKSLLTDSESMVFAKEFSIIVDLSDDIVAMFDTEDTDSFNKWSFLTVLSSKKCSDAYFEFGKNYFNTQEIIGKYRKKNSKEYSMFKKLLFGDNFINQNVSSVFIQPFSRVPRYLLLLRQLEKFLGVEDPHRTIVESTILKLKNLSERINLEIKRQEIAAAQEKS